MTAEEINLAAEAQDAVLAKVIPPTVWQHRMVIVWNAANNYMTTKEQLVRLCTTYGFKTVCVKVADGPHLFSGAAGHNLEESFYAPLRAAGIIVGGWTYAYGNDPAGEVAVCKQAVQQHQLKFLIVDAEREFDAREYGVPGTLSYTRGYGRSAAWVHAWQKGGLSSLPVGLTSFGRCGLHDIDWRAWAHAGFRWLPQTYYNESYALSVPLCVDDGARFFDRRFIHPMLGTYGGYYGRVNPAVYAQQMRQAGTRGFSIYSGDDALEADYQGLAHSS
jgi:hypothetical protein